MTAASPRPASAFQPAGLRQRVPLPTTPPGKWAERRNVRRARRPAIELIALPLGRSEQLPLQLIGAVSNLLIQ